jgi:hypothetical protein
MGQRQFDRSCDSGAARLWNPGHRAKKDTNLPHHELLKMIKNFKYTNIMNEYFIGNFQKKCRSK